MLVSHEYKPYKYPATPAPKPLTNPSRIASRLPPLRRRRPPLPPPFEAVSGESRPPKLLLVLQIALDGSCAPFLFLLGRFMPQIDLTRFAGSSPPRKLLRRAIRAAPGPPRQPRPLHRLRRPPRCHQVPTPPPATPFFLVRQNSGEGTTARSQHAGGGVTRLVHR